MLNVMLGIYRNESVNGEAVSWSFLVNGPWKTLKRWDPELVIIIFGMSLRVLLMERA